MTRKAHLYGVDDELQEGDLAGRRHAVAPKLPRAPLHVVPQGGAEAPVGVGAELASQERDVQWGAAAALTTAAAGEEHPGFDQLVQSRDRGHFR